MAPTTSQAGQAWHHALKLRKHLLQQLEKLQARGASGIDVSQFEAVDGLLEKFRLACVQTIFLDFTYAVKESTEEALWGLHTSINAEYRRILSRPKHNSHAVERRKVEKMYNHFLRIAQKFYKGYIQRLSARYEIQELRRVARSINVEQMDAGDTINPVSAGLSGMILNSCHSTLLHLGDLARYRIQAKHKTLGYEAALTYYSLARHLMPQSGFAFHQIGIVNLDQANHLDVVYNFYRAWAVEFPHPNAKSNLESEFKSLRLPNAAKIRHSPPAQDAFSTWFVKLHALFYQGKTFSQQKELEEEVMHRLDLACHNENSGDMLLKMALVNMSAYDIGSNAVAETNTDSTCRFWQFTLRFNALFVMAFCRALQSELQEAVSNRAGVSSETTAVELTGTIQSLLPTLRMYCVWLAARRQELFGTGHAFGAIVPAMMQNIVKVFTLLCVVTYNRENLASCPYLLSEDIEVRGIRPLSGEQVPEACRVYCDENGNMKPNLHDSAQRLDASRENLARVLDVLRCAYFLAEDVSAPVSYQVVQNYLVFEYQSDVTSVTGRTNTEAVPSFAGEHATNQREETAAERTPAEEVRGPGQLQASEQDGMDMGEQQVQTRAQATCQISADEDHAEKTVIAMLTPFLKPPSPPSKHHARSPDESSYGMHTATANGIFAYMQTYQSSNSSVVPFPWAWDNTPKPDDRQEAAASAGREAFTRASCNNSPKELISPNDFLEDPFVTPGRDASRGCSQAYPGYLEADMLTSAPGSATAKTRRDHAMQSFSSTGTLQMLPFTQWGGGQETTVWGEKASPLSPWVSHVPDQVPASTSISGFSHPSSLLYMGTPADGIGLGVSGHGDLGHNYPQSPAHGENGSSSTRRVQIGDSASSYDEAIFRAAWVG